MFENKSLILLFSIIFVFAITMTSIGVSENQAPEFQKLVREGELEPLNDRLPEKPLMLEPLEEIGEYGGTWNRFGIDEEFDHVRMSLYGHSFLRWENDGKDIKPNLITDWEQNEDATEWILYFREGLKWSDGESFTVDDVLFWWEDMVLNEEFYDGIPPLAMAGGEPVEMVKIDDYTLKFIYEAPAPLLPERLADRQNNGHGARGYAPKHYLKDYHPEYSNHEDASYDNLSNHVEWWIETDTPVLSAWKPVEYVAGERVVYERNPYFYATDPEGNQLPYIDEIEVIFQADMEVLKLQLAEGKSDFQIRPNALNIRDVSMLQSNAEEEGFEVILWNSGSGTGPIFFPNRNHPDEKKREIYRNKKFNRALSHAINRDRINRIVFYDLGEPTTGTLSPQTLQYRTEKGEELYEEWKNLAIEYDPEKAESYLDEIGVIDQNGDGWRQLPNGDELIVRIDVAPEAGEEYVTTNELVQEDWEEIGVETIINTVEFSTFLQMQTDASFDMYDGWEIGGGYPIRGANWIVPIDATRWAPLYGSWYSLQGTHQEGVDADLPTRERSPKWKKPAEGGLVDRLQTLHDKSKIASTEEERNKYVYEIFKLHIEEGPVMWGTVKDYPRVGVVSTNMKNVPRREDLAAGGWVNPWTMVYPGQALPATWYFDQ